MGRNTPRTTTPVPTTPPKLVPKPPSPYYEGPGTTSMKPLHDSVRYERMTSNKNITSNFAPLWCRQCIVFHLTSMFRYEKVHRIHPPQGESKSRNQDNKTYPRRTKLHPSAPMPPDPTSHPRRPHHGITTLIKGTLLTSR